MHLDQGIGNTTCRCSTHAFCMLGRPLATKKNNGFCTEAGLPVRKMRRTAVMVCCASALVAMAGYESAVGQVSDTQSLDLPNHNHSAPATLAERALRHSGYRWIRDATDHMDLYFFSDSHSYERGRAHHHHAEAARKHALGILGAPEYESRVGVFYLDAMEDMQALFGAQVLGKADPPGNAVALVLDEDVTRRERHEIMHVLSWGSWGGAAMPNAWISEGLAVFAQGDYLGHDLHHRAHQLGQSGSLLPIDTLIHCFLEQGESVSYVQAGSLVRFVHEVYGVEVLRGLWQQGVGRTVELTGRTLAQLDAEWRLYVADTGDVPLP